MIIKKLKILLMFIFVLFFSLTTCKNNNTDATFTLSDFKTCIIELEAIGHYTGSRDSGGTETWDYDRGFNGEDIIVSGSFSGNTFIGNAETNLAGGSIIETVTAVLNDNHDTIVSITGSKAIVDDGVTEAESFYIVVTDIPILAGFDSNLAEFQILGIETCDHIMLTHSYQNVMESNWALNSLECNSDSNIDIRFQIE